MVNQDLLDKINRRSNNDWRDTVNEVATFVAFVLVCVLVAFTFWP